MVVPEMVTLDRKGGETTYKTNFAGQGCPAKTEKLTKVTVSRS